MAFSPTSTQKSEANESFLLHTVYIRLSAQPRISTHPTRGVLIIIEIAIELTTKTYVLFRDFREDRVFLVFYKNLALVHLYVLLLFIVFVAKQTN